MNAAEKLNRALDGAGLSLVNAKGKKSSDFISRRTKRAQAVRALLAQEMGKEPPRTTIEDFEMAVQPQHRRSLFGRLAELLTALPYVLALMTTVAI